MGKVLAIDYGLRTGLAVTDENQVIAFGLTTVKTPGLDAFLEQYCREHPIDAFVVGIPMRLNNTPTDATPHVEGLIRRLKKKFPEKEIYRMDERFTSSMASKAILESGVKKSKRQDKSLVDMVSATIILQSWLMRQSHQS